MILSFGIMLFAVSSYSQSSFITHIPSSAGGSIGIAVKVDLPASARYVACGAPVVVKVAGGWGPTSINPLPDAIADFGFIHLSFNFPGGGTADELSGGIYDNRGTDCITATKDVIRFALGLASDTAGKTLNQYCSGFTPDYNNVGLAGFSNGGNLTITTTGKMALQLPGVNWILNFESPVGNGMPNVDAGSWSNPIINTAYNPTTGTYDYTKLKYSSSLLAGTLNSTNYHGGFYFDLNTNNQYDTLNDYKLLNQLCDDGIGVRAYYSEHIMQQAYLSNIVPPTPPSHIPSFTEDSTFWSVRNGEYWIDSVINHYPQLMFMILGTDKDHVQRAPNHPHVLLQNEMFRLGGAYFVRLNPDKSYVDYVCGAITQNAVDNPAFSAYTNTNISSAMEPEESVSGILENQYKNAGIIELADRIHNTTIDSNLSATLSVICSTSIEEHSFSGKLSIFPNPASDFIFIKTDNQNATTVSLINILGKVIASDTFKKGEEIKMNVRILPAGIYFIRIQSEQSVQSGTIIINR